MTRYIVLLLAAYGLLAVESALPPDFALATPHGSFLWMLLPWLATLPSPNSAIIAAAGYGLMLDALTNHHPGLLIAVTIVAVSVMRWGITETALETSPRVFIVSFLCSTVLAMLSATCTLLTGTLSATPVVLLTSIAAASAFAALITTGIVASYRVCVRPMMPTQELIQ